MRPNSVAFLFSVPVASDLHRQLTDRTSPIWRQFFVLPWGREAPYCCVRWDGSLESYLRSIGRKSREDLKRCRRQLFGDEALKCQVKRFASVSDVDIFLRDASQISDQTWQKKELGEGISPGGAAERTIRYGARDGNFCAYILYINERPAAFQYGFICGGRCFMAQAGYDPASSHYQPGSVLFFELLRDFERRAVPVSCLDFGPHATLFKLRTTNQKHAVRHFYLFRRAGWGAIQYTALRLLNILSRSCGELLEALKLRRKLHWSVQK
jgi:hypothetical protein